jgi:hypothetical protein
MSDLVKRLREGARYDHTTGHILSPDSIMDDAADRIEALEAALRQARDLIRFQQEWIDAVPDEPPLPAMPGFDGDWADSVRDSINDLLNDTPEKQK